MSISLKMRSFYMSPGHANDSVSDMMNGDSIVLASNRSG